MKNQRLLLVAGLSCLFLAGAAQNSFASDTVNQLNGLLDKIVADHAVWARNASLLRTLTLIVALVGLAVGIIRPLQFRGSKVLGIVLPVASCAIIAVNSIYFSADYRAFDRLWRFADRKIYDFRLEIDEFSDPTPEQRATFFKDLRKIKSEIGTFEEETLKSQVPVQKAVGVSTSRDTPTKDRSLDSSNFC